MTPFQLWVLMLDQAIINSKSEFHGVHLESDSGPFPEYEVHIIIYYPFVAGTFR